MSFAVSPLIYLFAFLAVVILAQALAGVFFSSRDKTRRVNRRLDMLQSGMGHEQVYSVLTQRSIAPEFRGIRLPALYERVEIYCRQAGLRTPVMRLVGIAAGVAGGLWLIGLTIVAARGGNLIVNGIMSLVGAALLTAIAFRFWIGNRHAARLKKIEQQLPLALDVVTRAIKAGHPVISAVQLAADELSDPIGSEFGLIVDETTYGAEFKEALVNFARRTGSADAHYFAVAVSIQSETGGNLTEILEGLTRVVRGRGTLIKRVKALSSEGMASAYLLSALPVGLIAFTLFTNPKTYTDKFSDPIFWPAASIIFGLYLCGWLMIRRIMNFKY